MRDDQKSELDRIQEIAIDHAIESIDAANDLCDISDKEGRGDRVWLTKGANESMKLVCVIQRFFEMKANIDGTKTPQQVEDSAQSIIDKAEKQLAKQRQNMGQAYS